MKPRKVKARLRTYDVIAEAVEEGVEYGISRAYKHSDKQLSDEEIIALADNIQQAVLNELCDKLTWEEE